MSYEEKIWSMVVVFAFMLLMTWTYAGYKGGMRDDNIKLACLEKGLDVLHCKSLVRNN